MPLPFLSMATTTLDWGDGSGDKLYVNYTNGRLDEDTPITSDPNTTGNSRMKVITYTTTEGGTAQGTVTVTQASGSSDVTVTLHPGAFVSGTYASISGQNNPVGKDENNTTYATVNLKTGNGADTTAFWSFDCSSIPAGATIVSVSCRAKAMTQQAGGNRVTTYEIQMYKGTSTAKGSSTNLTTSASALNLSCGSWTRSELDQCYIRLHAIRGKNSTTTTYYLRFYGATLTVVYRE